MNSRAAEGAVGRLTPNDRSHRDLVNAARPEVESRSGAWVWSAVGAGTAIAFSFLGAAGARAAAPHGWADLAACAAYPVGFLMVIGGRYQLYTENTLAPVSRVLERLTSVPRLLQMWSVILFGNVVGAVAVGSLLAMPGVLPGPVALAAPDVMTVLEPLPPGVVFVRALLAGWLVAAMVWLLHASRRASPFLVVWGCTALMPLLHLEHIVVGTVEATYAWWLGLREAGPLALHLGVALLGNTVGGVLLVAVINHARTRRVQSPNGHLTTWEMLSTFQAARASTPEPWSRKPTNPPD